jgi:hypothetical protein
MNMTARQVVQSEIDRQIEEMERITCRELEQECRLKQWGKWGRLNATRLGYSRMPAFQAKGWGEPNLEEVIENITDEEGVRTDAAVASLPPRHKEVIMCIYLNCIPWLKLPVILGMGRRQIEFYQGQAVGIIWTKLRG